MPQPITSQSLAARATSIQPSPRLRPQLAPLYLRPSLFIAPAGSSRPAPTRVIWSPGSDPGSFLPRLAQEPTNRPSPRICAAAGAHDCHAAAHAPPQPSTDTRLPSCPIRPPPPAEAAPTCEDSCGQDVAVHVSVQPSQPPDCLSSCRLTDVRSMTVCLAASSPVFSLRSSLLASANAVLVSPSGCRHLYCCRGRWSPNGLRCASTHVFVSQQGIAPPRRPATGPSSIRTKTFSSALCCHAITFRISSLLFEYYHPPIRSRYISLHYISTTDCVSPCTRHAREEF